MKSKKRASEKRKYAVKIFGVVQGVGYRPYVYNQAKLFDIKGWVNNQGSALVMDIEGEKRNIKEFLLQVIKKPPSLGEIEKIKVIPGEIIGYKDFQIKISAEDKTELKFIGVDGATCPSCLTEIFDPSNHRYQYPFTNCTACGPRYSIIKKLPYDRKNTTMDQFQMCSHCEKEYHDPTDRRFHAQPNCCPSCGPTLRLMTGDGKDLGCDYPIEETIDIIKQGKIVAIKGLGGFHLACDAQNEKAVTVLRARKNRPHKPLAIMVKDLETAKELCFISESEKRILLSNKRPILLLRKKDSSILSDRIAPNVKTLGIMLPYTPLHYLLFQRGISSLVMTSGNRSSAPIQYENHEAIKNLGSIADYFLIHNRIIHIPVEDSVVKVVNDQEVVVRRARGYTPFIFSMKAKHEILALGAEQKSTFCLSQNEYGYMSQYLGDLKDLDAYTTYEKAIGNLVSILGVKPRIFVHDLQQNYLSSQYPKDPRGKEISVQHHHAHMVSCMVEHNLISPVVGVVFDGTGLGEDGKIWGGEFFVGTRETFMRAGHFKYVTIQGGDQGIKEPWRVALSHLYAMGYEAKNILKDLDEDTISTVTQALARNLNCYDSSSVGRIFDCVAALLNICPTITYDAQGAIELENILDPSVREDYLFHIEEKNGIYQIHYESVIHGILRDMENTMPRSAISAKFHNTIGNATVDLVCRIGERHGIKNVVLSGGVFENNYLLLYIMKMMKEKDLMVYHHHRIPTNDSGISVGQLAIADVLEGRG